MSTAPLRDLADALAFLFALGFFVGLPLILLFIGSGR